MNSDNNNNNHNHNHNNKHKNKHIEAALSYSKQMKTNKKQKEELAPLVIPSPKCHYENIPRTPGAPRKSSSFQNFFPFNQNELSFCKSCNEPVAWYFDEQNNKLKMLDCCISFQNLNVHF